MKPFRLVLTVLSLGVIFSFSGCGGGGGSSESTPDKQFGTLSTKTWNVSTVTLGGVDQSSTWTGAGFKLTIKGTKGTPSTYAYKCTGLPALGPWPAGDGANPGASGNGATSLGTWAFGTDPVTQIIRDFDDTHGNLLNMTYTVTATTLTISFNYTGNGYSRVSSVSGNWVFNFTN